MADKKADLRRLFYRAGVASYFAAGAAAGAGADAASAAGAAAGAEAVSTAGAGAAGAGAAASLPQADKDKANTAAIRADSFISFPQLNKITGVLNLFVIHSPKSPSLRMARHSTTAIGKYQSTLNCL
jgi:hypothetical protein